MIKLIDIYNKFKGGLYVEVEDNWMPLTEGYCKGHDLKVEEDMLYGKIGEDFAQQMFEDKNFKVEIKTERDTGEPNQWKTTGNLAIEIRFKDKPSGLSTTESSVWMHLLSDNGEIVGGYIFKVDLLKAEIKRRHKEGNLKVVSGGDNNWSQLVLLPRKELFSPIKIL